MDFHMDFLFRAGAGYNELVGLIGENPRYVFYVAKQDKLDRRTKKSKVKGWVEVRHKQHAGMIKLSKANGECVVSVRDESGGLKLIGAWTSWIASNAYDLVHGIDIRIA